jgi:hypothetical protein
MEQYIDCFKAQGKLVSLYRSWDFWAKEQVVSENCLPVLLHEVVHQWDTEHFFLGSIK